MKIPKLDEMLYDVQIGDVSGQDSLMSVETGSVKDDILSILLFLLIIISTGMAGYFGPPIRKSGLLDFKYHQSIYLTPKNRYLRLSILFNLEKPAQNNSLPVKFDYTIKTIKKGQALAEIKKQFQNNCLILPGQTQTLPMEFFYDRFVRYDEADIQISFDKNGEFVGGNILWESLDEYHAFFNIWVRSIFIVSSIIVCTLFITRLYNSKNGYNKEQIITALMSQVAIYGTNPLYPLLVFFPYSLFSYIEDIAFSVSTTCVLLSSTLIIVLNSIAKKNKKLNTVFIVVGIYAFLFIFAILHEFTKENVFSPSLAYIFNLIYGILFVLYSLITISLSILTLIRTDSSERHKFTVYTIVFAFTFIFLGISTLFEAKTNNSSGASLKIATIHCFAILLVYFHWPYETSIDQQYNEGFDDQNVDDFEPSIDEEQINNLQIKIESDPEEA